MAVILLACFLGCSIGGSIATIVMLNKYIQKCVASYDWRAQCEMFERNIMGIFRTMQDDEADLNSLQTAYRELAQRFEKLDAAERQLEEDVARVYGKEKS